MKSIQIIAYLFFFVFGFCICLLYLSKISSDWVTACSTFILAFSILITILNNRDFYEIKRREKTIDLMKDWNYNLDAKNSLSRKFAEQLSEEELKKNIKRERIHYKRFR